VIYCDGGFSLFILSFIHHLIDSTISNAVLVLKTVCQPSSLSSPPSTTVPASSVLLSASSSDRIIGSLARRFDTIRHPAARACVLWLVGQYAMAPVSTATNGDRTSSDTVIPGVHDWAPDVLRKVAKSFADEVCSQSTQGYRNDNDNCSTCHRSE
jgi:AP-3 complex subunit beta